MQIVSLKFRKCNFFLQNLKQFKSILLFNEPKTLEGNYWHFREVSWISITCIKGIVVFSISRFLIYSLNLIFLSILFSLRKKNGFVGIFETWQLKKHQNEVTQGLQKIKYSWLIKKKDQSFKNSYLF